MTREMMEPDNTSSGISDMEYSGKSPLEILPDYEKGKNAILAQKPINYLDPYLYSLCFKELCDFASSNPKFKHSDDMIRFLFIFNKYFCNQAKKLEITLDLLKQSTNKQAEDIVLFFLNMIASIVDSIEEKTIKEAAKVRCQIGVASRLNMRKYYDPIRQYKDAKNCRINEFKNQFDLYWNEHGLDIQKRSQKRKNAKKQLRQPASSDTANSSKKQKQHPHKLYPTYFASFRVGFYRWEKKYEKDTEIHQVQEKIRESIDKLKSMASKKSVVSAVPPENGTT